MKKTNEPGFAPRLMILPWIVILLVFCLSCQKDDMFFTPGDDKGASLKYTEISPGKYVGESDGCEWIVSMPDTGTWNNMQFRIMIFFAHGMVDPVPYADIKLPDDIIGGELVEDIIVKGGMGYAATSYRDNGLVVLDAVEDVKALTGLVAMFFDDHPEYKAPQFLFLGGPSEGGLVTIKTVEKYPELFHGAVAICGPIGKFSRQLQYMGDFHVLFNYFFGKELSKMGINLGNPALGVHPDVMAAWKWGELKDVVTALMIDDKDAVRQLLKCAHVTVDYTDELAMGTAVLELLRFNIMLTNDITNRMGGVPYTNVGKWYWGSDNDMKLNHTIERIDDPSYEDAKINVAKYETSGEIAIPVVTIHTTGDHIVPFWHNPIYRYKVLMAGNSLLHTGIPVPNYGHCTIDESHIMASVYILISKIMLINYFEMQGSAFSNPEQLDVFREILNEHSIKIEFK